jgi:hypothetical protein
MIIFKENILDDNFTSFYLNMIKDKPLSPRYSGISETNYYNRYKVLGESKHEQIVTDYLNDLYLLEFNIVGSWVNMVDINSNVNDSFHYDNCDLTMITYLNDDFDGGEFEYIDEHNNINKIVPKKNLSIINNNSLQHRVLPVSNGIRFSLVYFLNSIKKTKKTML